MDQELLERRRRWGVDRRDEVWEGVLHVVPPPRPEHASVEVRLLVVLADIARRRNWLALSNVGVYEPGVSGHTSFRVPDISMAPRDRFSHRGIEGRAGLVIEILSPNDESQAKLPFYARVGVREVWLIDPPLRTIEVFAGTNRIHASALGLELHVQGSTLSIRDGADTYTVDISDTL